DYDADRAAVIELSKSKGLKAIITCGPDPKDYKLTFDLVRKHPKFVFAVVGIHPEYVKKFSEEEITAAMATIEQNRDKIVGIGETGLDYSYIIGEGRRERQRQMFAKFIRLAKRLDLPIVVHLRNGEDKDEHDVFDDAFEILEREGAKRVQLHMFGSRRLVSRAIKNGWYISTNTICLRSKSYSKVVRDTPMERLMLETDAPWLHPSFDKEKRNDPTHVREVAERVAEIKKINVADVVKQTTENAIGFFKLRI
ncbi:unnamed protein product, partial [marine sediment metagenome]